MDDMRDDLIANFKAITDASQSKAEQYLSITDFNLEQAIQLFFDSDGQDLSLAAPGPAAVSPIQPSGTTSRNAIPVGGDDDDDQVSPIEDDRDLDWSDNGSRPRDSARSSQPVSNQPSHSATVEDDEAMALRLQQEMFAEEQGGGFETGTSTPGSYDADGVRAPIARTTETLVGPEDDFMRQVLTGRAGPGRHRGPGRLGVFNQRPVGNSIWDEEATSRRDLAASTGGASETSRKASQLAEMFRPPFEMMARLNIEEAKDYARERDKWVLVNIQDPAVFDSQVLNRDLWKDEQIKEIIKGNFIFLQYARHEADGLDYIRLYMQGQYPQDFPNIAILDPRTGEQLKVWQRVPDKAEFIMQLHEFLDRYSLNTEVRNPVQTAAKPKKDVDHMTEEEMLDLALRNSMGGGDDDENGVDPDEMTKKGKERQTNNEEEDLMDFDDQPGPTNAQPLSAFAQIRNDVHHPEPEPGPTVTRIQLRMPDGSKVVRRFNLSDPVRIIFEYVKADFLPEKAKKEGNVEFGGREFELRNLKQNLIDVVDTTLEAAGLKSSALMLEFTDD